MIMVDIFQTTQIGVRPGRPIRSLGSAQKQMNRMTGVIMMDQLLNAAIN
jgi:hypothetical protein